MITSIGLLQWSLNLKAAFSAVSKSRDINIVQLTVLFKSIGKHIYVVVNTSETVSKEGLENWLFGNPSENKLHATWAFSGISPLKPDFAAIAIIKVHSNPQRYRIPLRLWFSTEAVMINNEIMVGDNKEI